MCMAIFSSTCAETSIQFPSAALFNRLKISFMWWIPRKISFVNHIKFRFPLSSQLIKSYFVRIHETYGVAEATE